MKSITYCNFPTRQEALTPKKPKNPNRMDWISFAAVISCLAVMYLHVNGCYWDGKIHEDWFASANAIESIFYFAVPVFFMISGSTLLDFYKRYGIKDYILKRVIKTVIPYVIWSLLSVSIYIMRGKLDPTKVDFMYILKGLSAGNLLSIYWFFTSLFCVYLSIPLYAAISEDKRKTVFTYLATVGFFFNILMSFLKGYYKWDITLSLSVGVLSSYLFFVPIGYLISHYKMHWSIRITVYAIGICGLLIHLVSRYEFSMINNKMFTGYKGYLNMPCILYSVAIFVFFRYAGSLIMKFKIPCKIFTFLSGFTFSVYLIHQHLIFIFVEKWNIDRTLLHYRLLFPFFLLGIIVFAVWLIRKIPYAKYILPS